MLNKAILMGRLTSDPELRHTTSNKEVVSFSLAVERDFKTDGGASADFINIVAWGKTAEFVSKYFVKGQLVAVTGRIQTRSYDDKEGNKRHLVEVNAEQVHFAEPKRNSSSSGDYTKKQGNIEFTDDDFEKGIEDEDGDLPF